MNENCGIARDLMPLVADDAAGEESRKWVEAHVAGCADCARMMNEMRAQIRVPAISKEDENFVRFCLQMKRRLSWRRVLAAAALAALTILLIAGGAAYTQYKMNVDGAEYAPETCALYADERGTAYLQYTAPALRGKHSWGTRYQDGVLTVTPMISAWPQLFGGSEDEITLGLKYTAHMRDGALCYVKTEFSNERVYDELTGDVLDTKFTYEFYPIEELRVGTQENYITVYRRGDAVETRANAAEPIQSGAPGKE